MPKIKLNTDYTKYFDAPTVAYKVTVYANSATVICCGPLLAAGSSVLEERIMKGEGDILLERFCFDGSEDGIRSCLAALHGENIDINAKNIDIVLKFSSIYKVIPLFHLGLEWVKKEMLPRMLPHIDNIISFLEDFEDRRMLSDAVCEHIANNTNTVCEEVTELMTFDEVISGHLISEITKLKPPQSGTMLKEWCRKCVKNILYIFENKDKFEMQSIFPDKAHFQDFVQVLMSEIANLGVEEMKHIVDLQNCYYTQQSERPESPIESRLTEDIPCGKASHVSITQSLEEETPEQQNDPHFVELVELVKLAPQQYQKNKYFSDMFIRSCTWKNYSFSEISDLSQNGAIDSYTFMDIIISWLESNCVSGRKFSDMWDSLELLHLNKVFVADLKNHFNAIQLFNLRTSDEDSNLNSSVDGTKLLSKTITAAQLRSLMSNKILYLSASNCPVVGCHAPPGDSFYAILELDDEIPSIIPQDKVDLSRYPFNSGHMHPNHVLHWYAVYEKCKIFPLNLIPFKNLKVNLALFGLTGEDIILKCVVSTISKDRDGMRNNTMSELDKVEMLENSIWSQSIENVIKMKFLDISPYYYIELCGQWIQSRQLQQHVFDLIISSFSIHEVSKEFLKCIKDSFAAQGYSVTEFPASNSCINTAKIEIDVDEFKDLLDEHCSLVSHVFSFTVENGIKYKISVGFSEFAPLLRVEKVTAEPRIQSTFIRVHHIYFQVESNRGNSTFVSMVVNDAVDFLESLSSRKKCYILFDYEFVSKT